VGSTTAAPADYETALDLRSLTLATIHDLQTPLIDVTSMGATNPPTATSAINWR
jgi:hypothetical protein